MTRHCVSLWRGPGLRRVSSMTSSASTARGTTSRTAIVRYRRKSIPNSAPVERCVATSAARSSLRLVLSPALCAAATSSSKYSSTAMGHLKPAALSRLLLKLLSKGTEWLTDDVIAFTYDRNMSVTGMSDLLTAMFAASGVGWLDALDHRPLHTALVDLGVLARHDRHLPNLQGIPDPEVGRRVRGVTPALWSLVGEGLLTVVGTADQPLFAISDDARARGFDVTRRLAPASQAAVYRAVEGWAAPSTARKKARSSASS